MLPPLEPTFDAALRDVKSKRASARLAAARRLGRVPEGRTTDAIAAFRSLVRDRDPRIRMAALDALANTTDLEVAEREACLALIRPMHADAAPGVRESAVVATAVLGGDTATDALRHCLESEHPEVRFQAAMGYAELLGPTAATELLPLMKDSDAKVRMHTATAIGVTGSRAAIPNLQEMLTDPVDEVRIEAALALAALGDSRAIGPLRAALSHREYTVAASLALGDLSAVEAADDLARLAKPRWFRSPLVRAAASAALARWGDHRGITSLRSLLKTARHDVRDFSAELVARYQIVLSPPVSRSESRQVR